MHASTVASGVPCHSGNFLRALRTIPEASALGLVFTDQNSVWSANVPRLVQSWNRFMLHQLSHQISPPKESQSGDAYKTGKAKQQQQAEDKDKDKDKSSNLVEEMYGMKQEKANTCCKCKTVVKATDTVLLCNLLYPENKELASTFDDVVCASLCPDQTTPAWCDKCRKYQATQQSRTLSSLPYVLSLNAGMDNQQDIDYWQSQMQMLYNKNKPEDEEADEDGGGGQGKSAEEEAAAAQQLQQQQQQQPPPNAKPCRYGLACSRPDCKFWHPTQHPQQDGEAAAGGARINVGDKLAKLGLSWVPHEMDFALMDDGKVTVAANVQKEKEENIVDRRKYKL